ncbi:uncharacterized protein LOC119357602 [Triticum dicoccoides]|uniref:uncharacterized protein LOC119357602 n=1 Tax=Triticum dicoccoides TaxID=85692 RepID=UPI00188FC78C|nr:uncharacterized protein LOC119357602 [Triticum dicoccoides]
MYKGKHTSNHIACLAVVSIDLTISTPDREVETGPELNENTSRVDSVKAEDNSGNTECDRAYPGGRREMMPALPTAGEPPCFLLMFIPKVCMMLRDNVVYFLSTVSEVRADVAAPVSNTARQGSTGNTHCMKFQTTIDGMAFVGSSPPHEYHPMAATTVIEPVPAGTNEAGAVAAGVHIGQGA